MTTKTTGAEFKQFYSSEEYWPRDVCWHEDEIVVIDGEECDSDVDYSKVRDSSVVSIDGGVVYKTPHIEVCSFEAYFKKWRKQQNTVIAVIEFDKTSETEVREVLKRLPIKVIK